MLWDNKHTCINTTNFYLLLNTRRTPKFFIKTQERQGSMGQFSQRSHERLGNSTPLQIHHFFKQDELDFSVNLLSQYLGKPRNASTPIKSLTHKQGSYASQNLSLIMENKITYGTQWPDVLAEHVDMLLTDRYAMQCKSMRVGWWTLADTKGDTVKANGQFS